MIVYAVVFSNYEPAEVVALYDNPEAADQHVAALPSGWRVTNWSVASVYKGEARGQDTE